MRFLVISPAKELGLEVRNPMPFHANLSQNARLINLTVW